MDEIWDSIESVSEGFPTYFIMVMLHEFISSAAVCEDKVLCKLYGQSICTDPTYYEWRRQNCPNFCGMCPTGNTPSKHTIPFLP